MVVVLWVLAALVAAAPPAQAHGGEPTSYRSEVVRSPDGVDAAVLGGDNYLELAVAAGREVVVLGYDDEPYLRVDADGVVWRNRASPATYLNAERYGRDDGAVVPARADPDAEPDWERVADDGRFAWHDHRVHWMSPQPPPAVDGAATATHVFDWRVPVRVDGRSAAVAGSLTWQPATVPIGWAAALVVLTGLGVVGLRRRVGAVAVALSVVATAAAAALLAGEFAVVAPGTDWPSAWFALPVAVVAAAGAGATRWRGREVTGLAGIAAISALVVALVRVTSLWQPIAPGVWPEWAVRALVVTVVASALLSLLDGLRAAAASHADDDDHARAG